MAAMLLLIGAFLPVSLGQQGNPPIAVFGTVYDSDGSTPLEGALVTGTNTASGEEYTHTTTAEGKYTFAFYDYDNGDRLTLKVEHGEREVTSNATLDYTLATQLNIDFTLPLESPNAGGDDAGWTEYLYEIAAALAIIIILLFILFWWWHEEEEGDDEEEGSEPPKYEKERKRSR